MEEKDMIIRRDTNIYPIFMKDNKNIPGISEAVLVGIYSEKKSMMKSFLVVSQ
jgi:hypothetical protein